MQWIQADERLPGSNRELKFKWTGWEYDGTFKDGLFLFKSTEGYASPRLGAGLYHQIEWLDESESPSSEEKPKVIDPREYAKEIVKKEGEEDEDGLWKEMLSDLVDSYATNPRIITYLKKSFTIKRRQV